MNITQSDFHLNPFSGFRHTPFRKSPLLCVILLRPELRPFIIIIPTSHPFVTHLIIHMFHTSVIPYIPYISSDHYLNPNLYTIPNMQNMRFFCCSVYTLKRVNMWRGSLVCPQGTFNASLIIKSNNISGPEVIKLFSYSTQLRTKFILLINVKRSLLKCQQLFVFKHLLAL